VLSVSRREKPMTLFSGGQELGLGAGGVLGDVLGGGQLLRHGGQAQGLALQGVLGLDAGGLVLDLSDEVPGRAVGRAHQRHRQVDPDQPAVLVQVALVHAVAGDLAGQQLLQQRQILFQVIRVGDGLKVGRQHLFGRVADDAAERVVDLVEAAFQCHQGHADRGVVERGLEDLQLRLARRDVVHQGREAPAVGAGRAADRQLDREHLARLPLGRNLDTLVDDRALAGAQEAGQALVVGVAVLFGDDEVAEALADRLLGRPAEGLLGEAVPVGDVAGLVDGDDGLVGVGHDLAGAGLAGPKLLLAAAHGLEGGVAGGDVLQHAEDGHHLASVVVFAGRAAEAVADLTVGAQQADLVLDQAAALHGAGEGLAGAFAILGWIQIQPIVRCRREGVGRQAVDLIDLLRPLDGPGPQVGAPVADAGNDLGHLQQAAFLLQAALGAGLLQLGQDRGGQHA
jgi:hypothetical protein